ncbi:MAG TPA: DUF4105 domain-containing protein, partial [Polyangiaceae bacterium]
MSTLVWCWCVAVTPAVRAQGAEEALNAAAPQVIAPATVAPAPATSAPAAPAAAGQPYADELVERARALKLSDQEMWKRLLHYRRGWFGGWESEADGRDFFLAEDGKTEPEHELTATLRGLFGPEPADPKQQHPLCRFPARVAWLARELGFDWRRIPARSCPRYEEFLSLLRPKGFALVFSSYYLNNPSSALGHTFLRVFRDKGTRKESPDLLDYGVDFSATVDTKNALVYAIKGLAGLFPGQFKRVPYFYKVREYNDHDSRDIWEYELNLSPVEVQMVAAHLWELGSTYFAYYYLSENCSYHVLGALQVANPKLKLLDEIGWPTVPADTIKALYKNPGFIRKIHYRPSIRTQFKQRLDRLTARQRDQVLALVRDPKAQLPADFTQTERVQILDTAIDLIDIGFADELLKERHEMDPKITGAQQTLLERRAEDLVPSGESTFAPPLRQMPHVGHDSKRIALGSGYRRERGYYHSLSFRLALHDLADPTPGYLDSAQIEFLPGNIRYYVEQPRLRLEDLSLVRVRSLSPISRYEKSMSWAMDFGMRRILDSGCRDCLTGFGQVGAGYTIAPFGSWLTAFALANLSVDMPAKSGALL